MKTIRARGTILINENKNWVIFGAHDDYLFSKMVDLISEYNFGGISHKIEADIPIPESQTIEGEVVENE